MKLLRMPFIDHKEYPRHPGQIIGMLRWKLGLSQQEFADRLTIYYPVKGGIKKKPPTNNTIGNAEKGKNTIGSTMLDRVAKEFFPDVLKAIGAENDDFDQLMERLIARLRIVKNNKSRNKIIQLLAMLVYTAE